MLAASGSPKDNENPVIHAVEEDGGGAIRQRPLCWSQLESLHVMPPKTFLEDDQNRLHQTRALTAADRAIQQAIVDAWEASRGEGVDILQRAGVGIPRYGETAHFGTTTTKSIKTPFIPAIAFEEQYSRQSHELEKIREQRDAVTSDETTSWSGDFPARPTRDVGNTAE